MDEDMRQEIERRAAELAAKKVQAEREAREQEERRVLLERLSREHDAALLRLSAMERIIHGAPDDGVKGLAQRVKSAEDDNSSQAGDLATLARGYQELAAAVERVTEGQLMAPVSRKIAAYSGGAAVGGGTIIGIIAWLLRLIGG